MSRNLEIKSMKYSENDNFFYLTLIFQWVTRIDIR